MTNFQAFAQLDKSKLKDQYVIIVKGKVVANGKEIETMFKDIRAKYPNEIPLIAKVPGDEVLVL